jgi:hypothetical protein
VHDFSGNFFTLLIFPQRKVRKQLMYLMNDDARSVAIIPRSWKYETKPVNYFCLLHNVCQPALAKTSWR